MPDPFEQSEYNKVQINDKVGTSCTKAVVPELALDAHGGTATGDILNFAARGRLAVLSRAHFSQPPLFNWPEQGCDTSRVHHQL